MGAAVGQVLPYLFMSQVMGGGSSAPPPPPPPPPPPVPIAPPSTPSVTRQGAGEAAVEIADRRRRAQYQGRRSTMLGGGTQGTGTTGGGGASLMGGVSGGGYSKLGG